MEIENFYKALTIVQRIEMIENHLKKLEDTPIDAQSYIMLGNHQTRETINLDDNWTDIKGILSAYTAFGKAKIESLKKDLELL